jgi:hypothetical protein
MPFFHNLIIVVIAVTTVFLHNVLEGKATPDNLKWRIIQTILNAIKYLYHRGASRVQAFDIIKGIEKYGDTRNIINKQKTMMFSSIESPYACLLGISHVGEDSECGGIRESERLLLLL